MNILLTGCAGFIGFHISRFLLINGYKVFGIDNLNNYYDIELKKIRLNILKKHFKNFKFIKANIEDINKINIYKNISFKLIIHLGAQAGVQFSSIKPDLYLKSNVNAFLELVLFAKKMKINKFIYASSSSVYGDSNKKTLKEGFSGNAKSFYALTKQFNESMATFFSKEIMFVGLRFFTVYGPFGRPDMAVYKFTENIYKNNQINLYNHGKNFRDYTYIDDLVAAFSRIIKSNKSFMLNTNNIFNIGFSKPIETNKLVSMIEKITSKKAKIKFSKLNDYDVLSTRASNVKLNSNLGRIPNTPINKGLQEFINWYRDYAKIKS